MSSTPTPQSEPGTFRNNIEIGSLVMPVQPDMLVFPLTRDKFDLLRMGDTEGDEKRYRDVSLGCALAALVGLLGMLPAADWTKRTSFLVAAILLAITMASAAVFRILCTKIRRTLSGSGYIRIKEEIESHFTVQDRPSGPQALNIIDARYGVEGRRVDVTLP